MAPLPSHGLKTESVPSMKPEEKNKTGLPTISKWQIGLLLWLKVARRETERSTASAKRAATTHRGIPKGAALGAPLVTFPASGKSPGCRAERLHQEAQGLPAPHKSPGRGAERPLSGAVGAKPPQKAPGAPTHPSVERKKAGGRGPQAPSSAQTCRCKADNKPPAGQANPRGCRAR